MRGKVINWGKYTGKDFEWVLTNDPEYLKWCYYNIKNPIPEKILSALGLELGLTFKQRKEKLKRLVLTKEQHQIIKGNICPYCKQPPKLVDSSVIYGKSYGMIYYCQPCDAYCGVHKGTTIPLGRLANKELREWKRKAHDAFDPIYKSNYMTRKEAYSWLSQKLKLPRDYTHIGMFGVETCKKVVELCKKELE